MEAWWRNLWWHLKPTHWTNTCQAHCLGSNGWRSTTSLFFFDAVAARNVLECLCADRSPENLHPLWAPDLRRKIPFLGGTLLLGSTPACFQCGIESPLPPNQQVMDCSCAFGHADHAHVIEEREEVLPWPEESLHFAQGTEEASTGLHVRLPRAV